MNGWQHISPPYGSIHESRIYQSRKQCSFAAKLRTWLPQSHLGLEDSAETASEKNQQPPEIFLGQTEGSFWPGRNPGLPPFPGNSALPGSRNRLCPHPGAHCLLRVSV